MRPEAPVRHVSARAYTIPTDAPEADATFAWSSTTLVVAEVEAGGRTGLGYTYADAAVAGLIRGTLAEAARGRDALDIPALWTALWSRVRNLGRPGLAATAISAVDLALWDLKAGLLDLSLAALLGRRREAVTIYGSGGFTSYSDSQLREQFEGWVHRDGCRAVKMKIGSRPGEDPHRIAVARAAAGEAAELFIDANGAYPPRQALAVAHMAAGHDVAWFEEPVTSDDPSGLKLVREGAPAGMDIAAGEYVYTTDDARRLLEPGAVDVLQADATRCGGVTGFLAVAALADAWHLDLSGHCAPAMHRHVACSVPRLRHLEWFHDHARIEAMLFDGAPVPRGGRIEPDPGRPGHGLAFKHAEAERYAV